MKGCLGPSWRPRRPHGSPELREVRFCLPRVTCCCRPTVHNRHRVHYRKLETVLWRAALSHPEASEAPSFPRLRTGRFIPTQGDIVSAYT